jgi:hypothetical protein
MFPEYAAIEWTVSGAVRSGCRDRQGAQDGASVPLRVAPRGPPQPEQKDAQIVSNPSMQVGQKPAPFLRTAVRQRGQARGNRVAERSPSRFFTLCDVSRKRVSNPKDHLG